MLEVCSHDPNSLLLSYDEGFPPAFVRMAKWLGLSLDTAQLQCIQERCAYHAKPPPYRFHFYNHRVTHQEVRPLDPTRPQSSWKQHDAATTGGRRRKRVSPMSQQDASSNHQQDHQLPGVNWLEHAAGANRRAQHRPPGRDYRTTERWCSILRRSPTPAISCMKPGTSP